jgi:hypothetical protein
MYDWRWTVKSGSQSNVFDYSTGDVNKTEAVPPTTRMYPATMIQVPQLPWVSEEECRCTGPYHRALCPRKGVKRDNTSGG